MDTKHKDAVAPLDESLYKLEGAELDLYRSETGIQDEEKLKQHILAVQKKAYEICKYPCVRTFTFLDMRLPLNPAYPQIFEVQKRNKDAILLELGCCFGNASRMAIHNGFPAENIVTTDIGRELWNIGFELFKTVPEDFKVRFIQGDIRDPSFLSPLETYANGSANGSASPTSTIALKDIQFDSLNSLRGRVSVIFAEDFFHLFSKHEQYTLALSLSSLLLPTPGSVILGDHCALREEGIWSPAPRNGETESKMRVYCHSDKSWKRMWVEIFGEGKVDVRAELVEHRERVGSGGTFAENTSRLMDLRWSVTRL